MHKTFAFVVADDNGKPRKNDGTLIRSHCMRGKNKRVDSRRSRRQARKLGLDTPIYVHEPTSASEAMGHYQGVPPPVSGMDLVHFAAAVDDYSKRTLFKFFSYTFTSHNLYPFEHLLKYDSVGNFVQWLSQDVAFLHSSLLTTCAIDDFTQRRPPSSFTILHLRNTLSCLHSKLYETDCHSLDTIVFIIMTLATAASMFEDQKAASTHLQGLQQFVQVRGGWEYLHRFPKMHFKMDRIDLSVCLSTGRKPKFFSIPIAWDPFFCGSLPILDEKAEILRVDHLGSPELATIFKDLRYLADLLNETDATGTKLPASIFQRAMHSVQSRLFEIQDVLVNDVAECLRLGMLALLATTFQLPCRKMPYAHFATQLRHIFQRALPIDSVSKQILFWALIMSSMAAIEPEESQELYKRVVPTQEAMSWKDARLKLQSIIWIGCIHDDLGKAAFKVLENERLASLQGHEDIEENTFAR